MRRRGEVRDSAYWFGAAAALGFLLLLALPVILCWIFY